MNTSPQDPELQKRMLRLGVREQDLIENFILGSGNGGQNLQKTSSCVQLIHPPSQTEVKCQASRSRDQNRYLARLELCRILETRAHQARQAQRDAAEKLRRTQRPLSQRSKQRSIEQKRRQTRTKNLRRRPASDD